MVDCNICPIHGSLKSRGMVFEGTVTSVKPAKTAVVEVRYVRKIPKYERFEKRRSKISAHVPECMQVREGDRVQVSECRKISKTKAHVVTKVVSKPEKNE